MNDEYGDIPPLVDYEDMPGLEDVPPLEDVYLTPEIDDVSDFTFALRPRNYNIIYNDVFIEVSPLGTGRTTSILDFLGLQMQVSTSRRRRPTIMGSLNEKNKTKLGKKRN